MSFVHLRIGHDKVSRSEFFDKFARDEAERVKRHLAKARLLGEYFGDWRTLE